MALTRAQLLMGDSGQGPLLANQVRAVKAGAGITIGTDGVISVDSQSVVGLMKMGQTLATATAAYNSFQWPTGTGTVGQQLTIDTIAGGVTTLKWDVPAATLTAGLGINITSDVVKVETPIQNGPPSAGPGTLQAIDGSVYWDDNNGLMFVRYNDGFTTQWVQIIPVASAPSGATGSFATQDGKTVNVSNGIVTSIV